MVQVLDGRLLWLPESCGSLPSGHAFSSADVILALTLCTDAFVDSSCPDSSKRCSYSVPHYTSGSLGRAFGPLALDQVLRFCHKLDKRLQVDSKVILVTDPGDANERTNAAVCIGAYLVLKRNFSLPQLNSTFGSAEAGRKFVCSFASLSKPEPARTLKVSDCWHGLILARDQGWIDANCILQASERHRFLADCCDAAWIIPGKILVSADPITTANDPNPQTFSSVFPKELHLLKNRDLSLSSISTHVGSSAASSSTDADSDVSEILQADSINGPLHQDCWAPRASTKATPSDWVALLQESKISMVMRTNSVTEPGMVTRSYDPDLLMDWDIQHTDITLVDGGCPSPNNVRQALSRCSDVVDSEGGGLLIHCKGGFGRSVIMACCLIIHKLDVPGSALLGWVRIVRPGAVNTPKQEKFLQSLRGRGDLMRFVEGSHSSCGPPQCAVQ
mmetsp:Transcript_64278/g.209618  ORF Transcript_64278/g.209618 Transcript_64278/m.209618 type:complete len:447 (-) Transcript_64278:209-1549(-)